MALGFYSNSWLPLDYHQETALRGSQIDPSNQNRCIHAQFATDVQCNAQILGHYRYMRCL